ncbi:hypothetical protein PFY01_09075 [Brevundimonas vesicularis]|uniref:hypothetical protein n=1 Tax=Brevundimonas vesicularis TaxID=41276 RepID=UPI0022EC6D86|nr:hypothetical protein [Brevundimonas vesicularis]WBT04810.1 hypothetical protein PFY01_08645 [Brevundimonas vesicularis]WBT04894.1 hypothetical protein PFY01_09075 [Brevundimonas vesicularis]
MARPPTADNGRSVTPDDRFAQSVPPEVAGSHSFLLQAMFELKGSFSRVEQKVDALQATVDKLETQVDDVRAKVSFVRGAAWVVGGVIAVVVLVVGWLVAGDLRLKVEAGKEDAPPSAPAVLPQGKTSPDTKAG